MRTGKARSGYPVVDDLIDRIGLELERRPDLMDENGSRFDSLADRYLLEMAANHAAAVKDSSRVHVEQADRMFSEYVGITEQSLSESVRREQDLEVGGRMDRLSIDLAFIRARQGVDQDATLRVLTGSQEEASIAPPSSVRMLPSGREESRRILSLGKGPGALSDGAEVVVLHARRPGGSER